MEVWRSALLLVTLGRVCWCAFPAWALSYLVAGNSGGLALCCADPCGRLFSMRLLSDLERIFIPIFLWLCRCICISICTLFFIRHCECKSAWSHNPPRLRFTFVAVHQYALSSPSKCIERNWIQRWSCPASLCLLLATFSSLPCLLCVMFPGFGNSCNCYTSRHVKAAAEQQ